MNKRRRSRRRQRKSRIQHQSYGTAQQTDRTALKWKTAEESNTSGEWPTRLWPAQLNSLSCARVEHPWRNRRPRLRPLWRSCCSSATLPPSLCFFLCCFFFCFFWNKTSSVISACSQSLLPLRLWRADPFMMEQIPLGLEWRLHKGDVSNIDIYI